MLTPRCAFQPSTMLMAAGLFMSLNDMAVKVLTTAMPLGQLIAIRGVALLLMIFVFAILTQRVREMTTVAWAFQLGRGLINAVAMVLFVRGLKTLPLNDAIVLGMTGPIFVMGIAMLFGEAITGTKVVAVATGFTGIILIIGPRLEQVGLLFLWPIGAAFLEAVREVWTRYSIRNDTALATLMHTTWIIIVGAILYDWPTKWLVVAWDLLLWLFVCAVLLGSSQWLMIEAYRASNEASLIAPLRYFAVLWATLLSILVFGHWPTPSVVFGSCLVVVSGVLVMSTERARQSAEA